MSNPLQLNIAAFPSGNFVNAQPAARSVSANMADAAEELTFQFGEKLESTKHELEKHKVAPTGLLRAMPVEQIQELLLKLSGRDGGAKLEAAMIALTQQIEEGMTPEQAVAQMLRDPAKQALLLKLVAAQFRKRGKDKLAAQTEAAVDALEAEHSESIRTAINTADQIAAAGENEARRDQFRRVYREIVTGFANLSEATAKLLERFGEQQFEHGMRLLMTALGRDIAAARPSGDRGRLNAAINDIKHVYVIRSTISEANEILRRLATAGPKVNTEAVPWVLQLLKLTQQDPNPLKLTEIVQGKSTHPEQELRFLQGSAELLGGLPAHVWPEPIARAKWLRAAGGLLDKATAKVNREHLVTLSPRFMPATQKNKL